jgi:signal transduction histidine kinase/DNA-binding response OmpR family regulator/HPt (histidine-containing phosphotransfer) domain-containing protein
MKDAYFNAAILKKDSLLITITVYFFCLVQAFEYLKSGAAYMEKLSLLFFAVMVLFFLVLIYALSSLWFYSLATSLLLFCFYVLIVLMTNGADYFFIVCICIILIGYTCHEVGATLWYIIISNVIIGALVFSDVPIMEDTFSIILISWGVSFTVSCFLLYMTYRVSRSKQIVESSYYYAQTILERASTCFALIDGMHRALYISKAMAQTFRIACPHLMEGRPITDTLDSAELRSMLLIVMRENKSYEGTWEIVVDQQKRYYQILYQKPYKKIQGDFLCLNDVTDIMMAKIEAEQNAKTKSIFLANTSHEIRTPMNAILGMVELILRKNITPDVYEDAIAIKQSGENLLAIINDILDFSKMESGKFEITPTKYLFASLIHDVINIIRVKLTDKPIMFIVNVDNRLPKALYGDISRVRQVLLNLLSNAIKFTVEGYISLFISGEQVKGGDNRIMLYFQISDTGVGIKKEELPKLFGNFIQLSARPVNVEGTGLGLAISRSLCKLMGGDITVHSEFGAGSAFIASVIQEVTDDTAFAVVDDPHHKSVLVYDNRSVYAESISRTVHDLGVKCDIALNEEEFVLAVRRRRYKFVFVNANFYSAARVVLAQFDQNATIGILIEQHETTIPADCVTITTPAYAISVANVLNGNTEKLESIENTMLKIRFSAPSARALIVDDVPTNLKVATGLMLPYKLKIDTATSGMAALKLIDENEYDIIFMDHMMPIMDGIETLHKIREKGGRYRNLPVIVLTANAVVGMKEMFMDEGFDDYISKPIDTSKLDAILLKWIPKEKHQKSQAFHVNKIKSVASLTIEGVDVREGIKMANDSVESYFDILMVYIKDSKERYGTLCSFLQTIEISYPDPHILSIFTTQVHALKGASASIGAKKLSEEALKLEMAGKAAAVEFIKQNLGLFCSNLAVIIERIERVLPKQENSEDDVQEKEVDAEDRLDFINLKTALEDEDIQNIDANFEALNKKQFSAKVKQRLSEIGDLILVSDFKEAVNMLEELFREI